jgi:hypothetical protein
MFIVDCSDYIKANPVAKGERGPEGVEGRFNAFLTTVPSILIFLETVKT